MRQREWEEELRVWYVAMTRAIEHLVFVAPNSAGQLWWNLFLDALQLPHTFSEDTVLRIAQGCEVQVQVFPDTAFPPGFEHDAQRFQQLAAWLQGDATCQVEDLAQWLQS